MRLWMVIFNLILSVILTISCNEEQVINSESSLRINGRVYTFEENTKLYLADAKVSNGVDTILTDSSGNFQFCDLKPSIYKLTISRPGFITLIDTIELIDADHSEEYLLDSAMTNYSVAGKVELSVEGALLIPQFARISLDSVEIDIRNDTGTFRFDNIGQGFHLLKINYPPFETQIYNFELDGSDNNTWNGIYFKDFVLEMSVVENGNIENDIVFISQNKFYLYKNGEQIVQLPSSQEVITGDFSYTISGDTIIYVTESKNINIINLITYEHKVLYSYNGAISQARVSGWDNRIYFIVDQNKLGSVNFEGGDLVLMDLGSTVYSFLSYDCKYVCLEEYSTGGGYHLIFQYNVQDGSKTMRGYIEGRGYFVTESAYKLCYKDYGPDAFMLRDFNGGSSSAYSNCCWNPVVSPLGLSLITKSWYYGQPSYVAYCIQNRNPQNGNIFFMRISLSGELIPMDISYDEMQILYLYEGKLMYYNTVTNITMNLANGYTGITSAKFILRR